MPMKGNETIEEQEIELLHDAVEKSEKKIGYRIVQSEVNKKTISIVEEFIIRKKLICYGGTAINNILPKKAQFYNKNYELPDYDVFSMNAIEDAKELTNIFFKQGFENVETRAAMNAGTYKVYVNFYGVADITYLDPKLYNIFIKKGITHDHIHFSTLNFLRMDMYKELSRPQSEISRWEKVFKRLNLLNKYFPIHNKGDSCHQHQHQGQHDKIEFMRNFKGNPETGDQVYDILINCFIKEEVVFIGAYATHLYTNRMSHMSDKESTKNHHHIPDFDVLAINAKKTVEDIKEKLLKHGLKNIIVEKKNELWKIIPVHYEISIGKDKVCVVYETIACHSYNKIKENGKEIKIASIDTMLSFLLAFLFKDNKYYDETRIMCMAEYLMQVQYENRLKSKGIFKRFSVNCYGTQQTIEKMREIKAEKFRILKNNKQSKEYQKYFLRYNPLENLEHRKHELKKTLKKKKKIAEKVLIKKTNKKRTLKNKLLEKIINPFL